MYNMYWYNIIYAIRRNEHIPSLFPIQYTWVLPIRETRDKFHNAQYNNIIYIYDKKNYALSYYIYLSERETGGLIPVRILHIYIYIQSVSHEEMWPKAMDFCSVFLNIFFFYFRFLAKLGGNYSFLFVFFSAYKFSTRKNLAVMRYAFR